MSEIDSLPEMNISTEQVEISLENPTFDIYYRQYGIRRPTQLNKPVFHDITEASLPKNALYHYNPESPALFGPLENNPWFANDGHMKFVKHVVDMTKDVEGPILPKPAPIQLYIQSYRQKHRTLKLLRDFFQMDRQPNMVIIKNYCFLNHLYRYRPHMLLAYYKFYNFYSTIINHMNNDAKLSDRQQFLELRLPKQIYRRGTFNIVSKLYEKGVNRRILSYFGDDDGLLLLHFWMWLGPQRHLSIFNKIEQNRLSKINLILTDAGKFCILNLGELDKWRSASNELDDEGEQDAFTEEEREEMLKGEKAERIQIRFYNLLTQLSSFRTNGANTPVIEVPKYELDESKLNEPLDDDEETAQVQVQTPYDPELQKDKVSPADDNVVAADVKPEVQQNVQPKKDTPPPKSKTKPLLPDLPADIFEEEADDLQNTSLPVENTDLQPADHEEPVMVVTDPVEDAILDDQADEQDPLSEAKAFGNDKELTYDTAPIARAEQLLKDGTISAREYERVKRLAETYKTIPSPFKSSNPDETVETFMQIPEQDVKITTVEEIPDNPFIFDKGMLKNSNGTFRKQYLEKVLQKNIVQSVMAVQKGGFLVTDMKLENQDDAVNKIDVLKVKVQKIGGAESTLIIKIPRVDPETGTMTIAGIEYFMNYQRGDKPIRKVSPTEVSLTSYYGKLFIEKSERRKFNLEKFIITQIQSHIVDEIITDVEYRDVFDSMKLLPSLYQMVAKRFQYFNYHKSQEQSYYCYFDYKKRAILLGLNPEQVEALELKYGGVLFAKSLNQANEYWFMKTDSDKVVSSTGQGPINFSEWLNIKAVHPLEMAELNIFSKAIPVGIVLGYYLGLSKLLKLLKVSPRKLFRGQRLNLTPSEYALQFADEVWVFDRSNKVAELILSGFVHYQRHLHDYAVRFFDEQDVYGALLRDMGLGSYQETELRRIKDLFIDDISRSLLQEMHEPTEFLPLLVRAVQLLTTMQSRPEINMEDMVIRGHQRIAGHVYRELMKAIKQDDNKRQGNRTKLEMSPEQVLRAIMTDSSVALVDSVNPLHQLKEHSLVTFTGDGGRSKRSMVSHTRSYDDTDLGTISESTVDNQNVGVTTYLSGVPAFNDVYGTTHRVDPNTSGSARILSDSALLGVASTKDDQRRSI